MSARITPGGPRGNRGPDLAACGLAGAAVLAAAGGQAAVGASGWLAAGGLLLGLVLFAFAARRAPRWTDPEPPPPPRPTRAFLSLFVVATLLCATAGVAVFLRRQAWLTHGLWLLGLLLFAASAGLAARVERRPFRPSVRALVTALALVLLCLVLFGWQLTALPAEVHGDDAEVGLDAIRLLAYRPFDLFTTGWFELPRFHAAPTALGLQLFGVNLLGLRATSAALGTATVVLLFAVARRLWNFEVALLAALILAPQRFFIHLSRAGYHYVDTPLLSVLVLWLFLRLWQDRRLGAAVWCGIALGLGVQTYYASRLVPVLLVATWLGWLWGTRASERRGRIDAFLLIAVAALATAAPMAGYFAHDTYGLWERTRDTSVFSPAAQQHLAYGYGTDSLLGILLIQLRAALTLFNATADNSVQYGYGAPLFEPVSAVLFVLGCGYILARPFERRRLLALIWMAVPLVAGAALTIDAPFYPRISGLLPFAALLVALALHHLLALLRRLAPARVAAWLAGAAAVGVLAVVGAGNIESYFIDYAPTYRHSPSVEIAAWVRAHGGNKTTYMVGGAPAFFIRHGTISFLTWQYDTRDIEDLQSFLKVDRFDPATSVFVIMPQGTHLLDRLRAAVGPLAVQTHRDIFGDVAFLTAIPGSEESTSEVRAEPIRLPRLARALRAIAAAGRWMGATAAALAVVLGLVGLARRPRRPGLSALTPPPRERFDRWRRRWFGPDDRERRAEPPRLLALGLLAAIAAAAVALRVVHLADLPAGFFCDEAGNGYNAYSILHTGRDENGAWLPLYVWSFGVSYKNPVFIYSAMLPMALLGPTELAVRLTAALYGSGTVIALFFLGRALMGGTVGLIAALLLAVCPWHLHFSRIGFELVTLPFFFTLATTSLVRWTQGRRTLVPATALYGICLYTYVPAKLFVPLFLAGFGLLYRRALRRRWPEALAALAVLALTAAPVVVFDVTHRAQAARYFRTTTVLDGSQPPLERLRTLADNYAAFFSPEFLFTASTDGIARHRVAGHGELYPFFAPLLAIGAAVALLRRDRAMRLILLWLALYPIAPALMNEIPSASRGFIGAAGFCLLAAIGAGTVLRLATQVARRRVLVFGLQLAGLAAGAVVLLPAVRQYWHLYRDEYPRQSAEGYTGFQFGYRQVVEFFRRHYDEYDRLLLSTRASNQPEIFLRFYDGLRQPPRVDAAPPFEHREKLGVAALDARDLYDPPGRRLLLAALPEEIGLFADPVIVQRVVAPDGSTAFVLVEANRLKDFVSTWRVSGLYPGNDRSPPPAWEPGAEPPAGPAGQRWREYRGQRVSVVLNDFFAANAEHACAWAVNAADSDREQDVRVFAGFDDHGEVWLNGERLHLRRAPAADSLLTDSRVASAHLRAGRNTFAIRTCEGVGDWRFYFRLARPDGGPVEGMRWEDAG